MLWLYFRSHTVLCTTYWVSMYYILCTTDYVLCMSYWFSIYYILCTMYYMLTQYVLQTVYYILCTGYFILTQYILHNVYCVLHADSVCATYCVLLTESVCTTYSVGLLWPSASWVLWRRHMTVWLILLQYFLQYIIFDQLKLRYFNNLITRVYFTTLLERNAFWDGWVQ